MAFSLNQITRKKIVSKQDDIKQVEIEDVLLKKY